MLKLLKAAASTDDRASMDSPPEEISTPEADVNAELLTALGDLLLPYLGPVAKHVVRSTGPRCGNREELVEALALRIPDQRERNRFLHAVATSSLSSLPFHEDQGTGGSDGEKDGEMAEGECEETSNPLFTPEELAEVTRALAYYVGPLASRLVNVHKGKVGSMEELNLAVAKSIGDPDDWAKFLMDRRKKH